MDTNVTDKSNFEKPGMHYIATDRQAPGSKQPACIWLICGMYSNLYVTGFERTRLPRTQQEDTLFTITW